MNAHKNKSDKEDMKSQDKEDMGYGSHSSSSFTSVISIHLYINIELKYFVDNLKGYCTTQLANSPKEVVGS